MVEVVDDGEKNMVELGEPVVKHAVELLYKLKEQNIQPAAVMSILTVAMAMMFKDCWEGYMDTTAESFGTEIKENFIGTCASIVKERITVQ